MILKNMVNYEARLDRAFRALGDPTRLAILERLARGPATVSELAAPLAMSLPAVHQHLQVLDRAGLMTWEKKGRVRWCRFEPRCLAMAEHWITRHRRLWERRLDALGEHLAVEKPERRRKG